jgi:dTMP kinase
MTRRRFITLEGGEGVGKSTQAEALARRLRACGHEVVVTREPGGTPFAERLRAVLLSAEDGPTSALGEALLFNAARDDHLRAVIRPALARGAFVVCDRFMDSTRAYQGVAGSVAPGFVDALEGAVVGETRPGLTLVLELAPAVALARAHARRTGGRDGGAQSVTAEGDPFERRALAFHEALACAFRAIARAEPDRCRSIDATGSSEAVAEAIWQQIVAAYPRVSGGG